MSRALSKVCAIALSRRSLSREEAAMYLGIGAGTFDEMRVAGQIEPPRLIKGRTLWDIGDFDMLLKPSRAKMRLRPARHRGMTSDAIYGAKHGQDSLFELAPLDTLPADGKVIADER